MSDRLQEIRARLDAWHGMEAVEQSLTHPDEYVADVAWLVAALASEQAHAETLIERIDQLHLEITHLRFGKPTPDVAYDIAVRHGSVGGYMGPQSEGPPPPALPPVGIEVVNPFTGERITREADDA